MSKWKIFEAHLELREGEGNGRGCASVTAAPHRRRRLAVQLGRARRTNSDLSASGRSISSSLCSAPLAAAPPREASSTKIATQLALHMPSSQGLIWLLTQHHGASDPRDLHMRPLHFTWPARYAAHPTAAAWRQCAGHTALAVACCTHNGRHTFNWNVS